ADLHPGSFGELNTGQFQSERESRSLRLTGNGHGDDGARACVEHVFANDHNRAQAALLVTASRIQVRPEYIASQYAGHCSLSSVSPSSASACSNAGSSFALSRARRLFFSRWSLSRIASCTARLRLGKWFSATSWSSEASKSWSIVTAIFTVGIGDSWYD